MEEGVPTIPCERRVLWTEREIWIQRARRWSPSLDSSWKQKASMRESGGSTPSMGKIVARRRGQRVKKSRLSGPQPPQKRQGEEPANRELTHQALSHVASKSAARRGRVMEWSVEKICGARAARCAADSGNQRRKRRASVGRRMVKSTSARSNRINLACKGGGRSREREIGIATLSATASTEEPKWRETEEATQASTNDRRTGQRGESS